LKKRGGIKRKAVIQLFEEEPERLERVAKRQKKKEENSAACTPLFYILTKGKYIVVDLHELTRTYRLESAILATL
jgi:hypothetical protein